MKFWKYVALLFASLSMVACEEPVADGTYTVELNPAKNSSAMINAM